MEAAFHDKTYTDIIIALGDKSLRKSIVRSQGTTTIIEAMKMCQSNGTIHVISALGVGDSWKQLKWHAKLISKLILKSVMDDHQAQEDAVMNSSYPFHIIRPVGLTDSKPFGEVHVQETGFLPQNYIPRADVAKFVVESLIENKNGSSSICQIN